MKLNTEKKSLVIIVILLFIGVAVAPSINTSIVKASQDDDLVEVTTQACGISGFGNTTLKLTREQYQDLEQYLVEFRARLNQTTTREEAIPIFKDAVVELDKYGFLPRGMSVERAQQLITRYNQNPVETLLNNRQREIFPGYDNVFCLLFGNATINLEPYPGGLACVIPIGPLPVISVALLGLIGVIGGETIRSIIDPLFLPILFFNFLNPLKFMNVILFCSCFTNIYSLGLKGAIHSNSYILIGFTGIFIWSFGKTSYFIGFALGAI
jgi:hypothetical protein